MTPVTKRSGGFTLIELLVVVAIISILTSVAIPLFARYKQQAVDADMISVVRGARNALESFYVDNDTYLGATEPVLTNQYGFKHNSPGVTFAMPRLEPTRYCVEATAVGGTAPTFSFDSLSGLTVPSTCA
jgi:type IV pilus assembly protein PilA